MSESDTYEDIRAQVEKRFQERNGLYIHITVYVLVNLVMWLIYGFTSGMAWQISQQLNISFLYSILSFPWPLIIMAAWGIGLVAHGLNYYMRYGGGAERRRVAIQRAIERELARRTEYEKPKNDQQMRLTDDGELEPGDEDVNWLKHKHKNG